MEEENFENNATYRNFGGDVHTVRGVKRGVFKMEGSGIITWEDNIN